MRANPFTGQQMLISASLQCKLSPKQVEKEAMQNYTYIFPLVSNKGEDTVKILFYYIYC